MLRIAMGNLIYSTLAYATMSQAYIRASRFLIFLMFYKALIVPKQVLPEDPSRVAPVAAIQRVEQELIKRETKIVNDMLGISSLIVYVLYPSWIWFLPDL